MGGERAGDGGDQRVRPGHRQARHPLRAALPVAGGPRRATTRNPAAPAATASRPIAPCSICAATRPCSSSSWPAATRRRRTSTRVYTPCASRHPTAGWTLDALQAALGPARSKVQVALRCCASSAWSRRTATGASPLQASALDERHAACAAAGLPRQARERPRRCSSRWCSTRQTGHCRWQVLLAHFGEDEGFERCSTCDNCQRIARAEAERSERAQAGPDPLHRPLPEPAARGRSSRVARCGCRATAAARRERRYAERDGALSEWGQPLLPRGDTCAPRIASRESRRTTRSSAGTALPVRPHGNQQHPRRKPSSHPVPRVATPTRSARATLGQRLRHPGERGFDALDEGEIGGERVHHGSDTDAEPAPASAVPR